MGILWGCLGPRYSPSLAQCLLQELAQVAARCRHLLQLPQAGKKRPQVCHTELQLRLCANPEHSRPIRAPLELHVQQRGPRGPLGKLAHSTRPWLSEGGSTEAATTDTDGCMEHSQVLYHSVQTPCTARWQGGEGHQAMRDNPNSKIAVVGGMLGVERREHCLSQKACQDHAAVCIPKLLKLRKCSVETLKHEEHLRKTQWFEKMHPKSW